MNTHAAAAATHEVLPIPLRSEAFAEDVLEFIERAEPMPEPALRWLVNLAPLAVAMVGVAFAVVPPLV